MVGSKRKAITVLRGAHARRTQSSSFFGRVHSSAGRASTLARLHLEEIAVAIVGRVGCSASPRGASSTPHELVPERAGKTAAAESTAPGESPPCSREKVDSALPPNLPPFLPVIFVLYDCCAQSLWPRSWRPESLRAWDRIRHCFPGPHRSRALSPLHGAQTTSPRPFSLSSLLTRLV